MSPWRYSRTTCRGSNRARWLSTSLTMPGVMRVISDWLPLTAAVELIRPLFLGQWPADGLRHLAVLVVYGVAAFWIALALTRRRFRN